MTSEGLPRSSRLSSATLLHAIMTEGKRRRTDHLDLFTQASPAGCSRLAVIVPRHSHTAVERNRLRRRLREIGRRRILPVLPTPTDVAVRARAGAYAASFAVLATELLTLCPSSRDSSS